MTGAVRISPILAWALLVALAASLWAGVVLPVRDWSATEQERLEQGRALLARQQALLGSGDALSTVLTRAHDDTLSWPVRFGKPGGRNQTELQAQLRDLAATSGIELTRFQVGETVEETERLALLALRMDGEGSLEQIQSLLIALRRAEPVILIGEAAIRATGREGRLTLGLDLRAPVLEAK